MKKTTTGSCTLAALALVTSAGSLAAQTSLSLEPLGVYQSGLFDESAAEILAHDPGTQRLFVVNAFSNSLDVLDIQDPSAPSLLFSIDMSPYGAESNSVAVGQVPVGEGLSAETIVAVAVAADPAQDPGRCVFLDTDGQLLASVTAGALPDMVTFTPDGRYALVANEGEPDDDYLVDPEGSVSVIDLSGGVRSLTDGDVANAGFNAFDAAVLDPSVRIFGPGASVSQDLEPEYIAVSDDSSTAWVCCQEANALAILDVQTATITDVVGLGFKDHSLPGNALDASNEDGTIRILNWPVLGMYQPDAIAAFTARGGQYVISANEGDSRDYDGYSEEERVEDLTLDPIVFPDAATLQEEPRLGRLKTTSANGDADGDGLYEEIYCYGGRSFSIWGPDGSLVYDSGDLIEQITAFLLPDHFNSTDDENGSFDDRSDDKGPEPEGVVVGKAYGRTLAFLGLERLGGIMVFDVTRPNGPTYVDYVNTRDFAGDPEAGTAGDLAPEGLAFIAAEDSPTGTPLLAVGFEISGTTRLFELVESGGF